MFQHIAIPTIDIEKSKKFYSVLGFKCVGNWERKDQNLIAEQLQHSSGWGIELVQHPSVSERTQGNTYSLHLGLVVDNIDDTLKHLETLDVEIVIPITKGLTVKRFIFISDPSGFPVELFEKK